MKAKKGGETGINGEFYKGGQFMANSENTVKGAFKANKIKKQKQAKIDKVEYDRKEKVALEMFGHLCISVPYDHGDYVEDYRGLECVNIAKKQGIWENL